MSSFLITHFTSDLQTDKEFKGVFAHGSSQRDPAFTRLLQCCKDNFNEVRMSFFVIHYCYLSLSLT
jgi:hypothetical protein